MVSTVNSSIVSALFGGGSTTSGVSADLLTSWAMAKAGIGVDEVTAGKDPNAPLAPVWTPGVSPSDNALVQRALTNKSFFNVDSQLYTDLGATGDYRRLFALYSGLTTLSALSTRVSDETLSALQRTQTQTQFTRGMSELEAFFAEQKFDDIRFAQGDRVDTAQTTLALPTKSEDYTTAIIHRGGLYDTLSGLNPNAQFHIVATSAGAVRNVAIDLSEMGSIKRTLGNVLSFINGELSAAGASSRLEAQDKTPRTTNIFVGGKTIETRYVGPRQYALKVDVRAGEKIAFEPVAAEPAFYALGTTSNGARLIKLQDVGGEGGQPVWLDRPGATIDPVGALIGSGWYGAGAPYTSAPTNAVEQRSNALLSPNNINTFEDLLREAGEAVLKLDLGDGRVLSVSTAWRTGDQEAWRARVGEGDDQALMDDLAERLTQLLHEQGVAAGVDVWEDGGQYGLSVFTGDLVRATSLTIGGKAATLSTVETPGMVGGLHNGIFARAYEAAGVAATTELFVDAQTFVITTSTTTHTITIDGGGDGVGSAVLAERLNLKLREKGIAADAYLVDDNGSLTFRVNGLHDLIGVKATLNETAREAVLRPPGAWANGGLPISGAGQLLGDAVRNYDVATSPLLTHTGALDIAIVVATATGDKTINVAISAQERLDNPDVGPGHWNAVLQARLDAALNGAGVYVGAADGDLSQWHVAEASGQRLVSVTVNGDVLALEASAPALGLGGAFSAERSFTSANAATSTTDDVAALLGDQTVSITFDTIWGARTVSATLEPGDPRNLESTALRLNEALTAQGYDVGVAATALSGGGAGLRIVTGYSHTVRGISDLALGGVSHALTLDPIDAISHGDDPVGALRVYERAARGAAVTETVPADSKFVAPTGNASAWFPGRAFDVSVGGGAKIATARAVATAADGAVYVLADLSSDSANTAIAGSRDVALLKYDSAGKLAFTEILGAAEEASGFALAVSADGKVAVAGAVRGGLSGTTAKGGDDSFVTMFDASGKELWTARRAATGDDQVNAISFASDGSLVVAGTTASALAGNVALGGADGYVRGYSVSGAELFTRQFGTSGADSATALLVRGNGAGGLEIFTGGVENNRGVVRAFTYSSGSGLVAGATRDIGYFFEGAINALAANGSSLYVGGQIGADRLTLGTPARASVAGKEGFVARLDSSLVSTALDRASYLGSSQNDAVKSLAIVNGDVYAAGVSGGLIAGQGISKSATSFLTRLDDQGEAEWTRSFSSSGGALTLTGLAVDTNGASALDALGLPKGVVASNDSGLLVNRSALRVGDEFKIGADGGRLTPISIGANDTLGSLVDTINRAIAGAGRASIVKQDGFERIEIKPSASKAVRIDAGRDGKNALPALGLIQGVVATNAAGRGALKTYGLGLIEADLKLDSKENIAKTKAELSAAISIVRQAYEALLNPNAAEMTDAEKALEERRQNAGPAPAYLTAQLAKYRAALSRLGGG